VHTTKGRICGCFKTVTISEIWELQFSENPIFGPNFCLQPPKTQKTPKQEQKKNLPNKISRARTLKFHDSKIFKGLWSRVLVKVGG
jgi:hypothetical protein